MNPVARNHILVENLVLARDLDALPFFSDGKERNLPGRRKKRRVGGRKRKKSVRPWGEETTMAARRDGRVREERESGGSPPQQ